MWRRRPQLTFLLCRRQLAAAARVPTAHLRRRASAFNCVQILASSRTPRGCAQLIIETFADSILTLISVADFAFKVCLFCAFQPHWVCKRVACASFDFLLPAGWVYIFFVQPQHPERVFFVLMSPFSLLSQCRRECGAAFLHPACVSFFIFTRYHLRGNWKYVNDQVRAQQKANLAHRVYARSFRSKIAQFDAIKIIKIFWLICCVQSVARSLLRFEYSNVLWQSVTRTMSRILRHYCSNGGI